ncbi:23S rRNA (cytidine2498-2'-O)-methyltransferase [Chitinivorax tropicus]|uniref:Ribosomal RNA large subunit methyltransferase M n=1 Tax=Chitinivorax tropicus TaxID=714531 RepID=A0A840MKR1_9PROT|nr:23S rRNA (cytidine(2498)-2'-O)-methyltransferase RlmM [Chitinivorax tropicus]MBB5019764.1 23S rRNA (cytidine2498-2'-O)-methyltransferase [Chitinivorax tropicus]
MAANFTPASLLVYCRPGFEPEAAAELIDLTCQLGLDGRIDTGVDAGYVRWLPDEPASFARQAGKLRFEQLMFARQLLLAGDWIDTGEQDRLTPVLSALAPHAGPFAGLWLEGPDTNDGKALSSFFKRFQPKLETCLTESGKLTPVDERRPRLHLFWTDKQRCIPGIALAGNRSDWPMGIPRLKMPFEAPSRSTLKLAEALMVLLGEQELRERMRAGQRAVDLGAAPGGWTWQLVNRGLRVTAIDNGPLKGSLVGDSLVQHLRVDGFKYRPKKPVDWLVCDMVEKPARIAQLMASWLADGDARQAIFNLKLPMKKRFDEIHKCIGIIEDTLARSGKGHILRIRQLYHDREEVTCFLARI